MSGAKSFIWIHSTRIPKELSVVSNALVDNCNTIHEQNKFRLITNGKVEIPKFRVFSLAYGTCTFYTVKNCNICTYLSTH
jgi:hypothetical protein